MIGQEKRDKWKKILPELLAVILCLVLMGAGVSRKEGYHMDELLSFELANARYNPWIVPTQPEGRLAKFVDEEIEGDSAGETLENLKNTVTDVLRNGETASCCLIKQMSMRNRSGSRTGSFRIMLRWIRKMPLITCRFILM